LTGRRTRAGSCAELAKARPGAVKPYRAERGPPCHQGMVGIYNPVNPASNFAPHGAFFILYQILK